MGAWRFVRERFEDGDVDGGGRPLQYAGRAAAAATAPGSLKAHLAEQAALVSEALTGADSEDATKGARAEAAAASREGTRVS